MGMSQYLQNFPKLKTNYARSAQRAEQDKNGYFGGLTSAILGWKADKIDAQNQKALYDWQAKREQERAQNERMNEQMRYNRARTDELADRQAQWNREDALANRNRGWAQEDAKTARVNALADTLRSWQREDSLSAQKQKREDALAQQKRAWDVEDRDAGFQHDMAKFLTTFQQKHAEKQKALEKAEQAQTQSEAAAMRGLSELYGVAERDEIGNFTRGRQSWNLTSDAQEQDLGALSAGLAAVAPMAISKLKEAGVSGVNSLPEFMTYIGLGENPTSAQLRGALPIISNTLGFTDAAKLVGPQAAPVKQEENKYGI